MDPQTIKTITDNHPFSFKGIWIIIKQYKYFKTTPFIICIVLALLSGACNLIWGNHQADVVMSIASANMAIFPALTGFSLTAFSVCVNFGNMDFAKKTVTLDNFSIYQEGIAVFAVSIIAQVIALGLSYFVKISDKFEKIIVSPLVADTVNTIGVSFLIFTGCLAFYFIFMIIANVFTFGQLNNSQNTIAAIDTGLLKEHNDSSK